MIAHQTKFTPGPWRYGGPVHLDAPGVQRHPSMPPTYWEIGPGNVEHAYPPAIACAGTVADARLIAAAPELYAALEAVLDAFNLRHPNIYLWTPAQRDTAFQARAAMAKARGEED